MNKKTVKTFSKTKAGLALAAAVLSLNASATIVQFETPMGNFEVNLYDQGAPETVANFLRYVEAGDFNNTIVHRSVPNFIIQGGAFAYTGEWPVEAIETYEPIMNEPVYSNLRGTIAMAKLSGDANSATSQWFINLNDNSENLDRQNEGFTVFGEVTGDGMAIIDQIQELSMFNFGGALSNLPLRDYEVVDGPTEDNLVLTNITIIDAAVDTAADLNPPLNIGPAPEPEPVSSGGGGSFGGLLLALAGLVGLGRRKA